MNSYWRQATSLLQVYRPVGMVKNPNVLCMGTNEKGRKSKRKIFQRKRMRLRNHLNLRLRVQSRSRPLGRSKRKQRSRMEMPWRIVGKRRLQIRGRTTLTRKEISKNQDPRNLGSSTARQRKTWERMSQKTNLKKTRTTRNHQKTNLDKVQFRNSPLKKELKLLNGGKNNIRKPSLPDLRIIFVPLFAAFWATSIREKRSSWIRFVKPTSKKAKLVELPSKLVQPISLSMQSNLKLRQLIGTIRLNSKSLGY